MEGRQVLRERTMINFTTPGWSVVSVQLETDVDDMGYLVKGEIETLKC